MKQNTNDALRKWQNNDIIYNRFIEKIAAIEIRSNIRGIRYKVLAIGKMLIVILRHFSFYFAVMICEEVDQKPLDTGQITMSWVDVHPFKWQ